MKGAEVPLMLDVIDFSVRKKWISHLQVFQLWNVHNEAVPISVLSSEFEKETAGRRKWVIACLIKDYEDSAMSYFNENSKYIKHPNESLDGKDYHFDEELSEQEEWDGLSDFYDRFEEE